MMPSIGGMAPMGRAMRMEKPHGSFVFLFLSGNVYDYPQTYHQLLILTYNDHELFMNIIRGITW